MKQIIPLGGRVLIQPAAAEKKTEGGIIIPDTSGEKPMHGNVLAIGDTVKTVCVGNDVMYDRYHCMEFDVDGQRLIIAQESDLLAFIQNN